MKDDQDKSLKMNRQEPERRTGQELERRTGPELKEEDKNLKEKQGKNLKEEYSNFAWLPCQNYLLCRYVQDARQTIHCKH